MLAPGSRVLSCGTRSHGVLFGAAAGLSELAARRGALRATHDVAYSWAVMRTDGDALAEVARLAAAGALRPHVGAVLPLASAAEAHAMVEQGTAGGKVVLRVEDTP
jgi:NADPH:quinone reductase-like Zn-dependent oxidoreductase